MIHDPVTPPRLPSDWPYATRPPLRPLACREDQTLPGCGAGWRICSPGGEVPQGEAGPLDGAFGRGGILLAGDTVIRPYRRGGLLRHLNERTYRSQLRFASECAVHRTLWEAGFPTVEPRGYAWRRHRLGFEGAYLSRLEAATAWPRDWARTSLVLPALQQALHSLCVWGVWAPDLNATNVLVTSAGEVLLLDWDHARFTSDRTLPERYRERMVRSLRKLDAPDEALRAFA